LTIRIVIADDHSVVRQGLRMFLALDQALEVVGEAANGEEALALTRSLKPNVVVMDLFMPVMDGIAATAIVRREMPEVEVIALTSVLQNASVVDAIKVGAISYLLKDTAADSLSRAIKAAAAGRVQLSPQTVARLLREVPPPENPQQLSERETEVLRLLAMGKASNDIAAALTISETAVNVHVNDIMSKLGVTSRTLAALFAVRSGLVSVEGLRPDDH
jgi:two-component system, NarL family, response regulator LiaR